MHCYPSSSTTLNPMVLYHTQPPASSPSLSHNMNKRKLLLHRSFSDRSLALRKDSGNRAARSALCGRLNIPYHSQQCLSSLAEEEEEEVEEKRQQQHGNEETNLSFVDSIALLRDGGENTPISPMTPSPFMFSVPPGAQVSGCSRFYSGRGGQLMMGNSSFKEDVIPGFSQVASELLSRTCEFIVQHFTSYIHCGVREQQQKSSYVGWFTSLFHTTEHVATEKELEEQDMLDDVFMCTKHKKEL